MNVLLFHFPNFSLFIAIPSLDIKVSIEHDFRKYHMRERNAKRRKFQNMPSIDQGIVRYPYSHYIIDRLYLKESSNYIQDGVVIHIIVDEAFYYVFM
jgi:hypothetical protein